MPNYNTMGLAKASLEASVRYLAASLGPQGVRVNGISAGPIKTLAASGIKDFGKILDVVEQNAPLRRNVTIDDVGNAAAFLLSDLAAAITAEIIYVDGGFSHAMPGAAEPRGGAAGPAPPSRREGSAAGAALPTSGLRAATPPRSRRSTCRPRCRRLRLASTRPWMSVSKPGKLLVEVARELQVLDDRAVEALARNQQRNARRVRRQQRRS